MCISRDPTHFGIRFSLLPRVHFLHRCAILLRNVCFSGKFPHQLRHQYASMLAITLHTFVNFFHCYQYVVMSFIVMELLRPCKRTFWGMMFQAAFGIGIMFVGAWGAIISNAFILQIIYALHSV